MSTITTLKTCSQRSVAKVAKHSALTREMWDFEHPQTDNILNGFVAQLGERMICTHEVAGAVPVGSTFKLVL